MGGPFDPPLGRSRVNPFLPESFEDTSACGGGERRGGERSESNGRL